MANVALTTTNNPWNPFTQFKEWYAFDLVNDYGCCEYLDRVSYLSSNLSGEEAERMKEEAIDEIVNLQIPLQKDAFYKKVKRNS